MKQRTLGTDGPTVSAIGLGSPRFSGTNVAQNRAIAGRVRELAAQRGITPAQLALAWVLTQGEDVVPIPGTKRRSYLEENLAATEASLSADELAGIAELVPAAAGERYDAAGMAAINQ
jgi:aryl-alcohol dehydrogenase-like predicted oxidoreductase